MMGENSKELVQEETEERKDAQNSLYPELTR